MKLLIGWLIKVPIRCRIGGGKFTCLVSYVWSFFVTFSSLRIFLILNGPI